MKKKDSSINSMSKRTYEQPTMAIHKVSMQPYLGVWSNPTTVSSFSTEGLDDGEDFETGGSGSVWDAW